MIEILQKLFLGHAHRYIERSCHPIRENSDDIPDAYLIVLRCGICGRLKNHLVKG